MRYCKEHTQAKVSRSNRLRLSKEGQLAETKPQIKILFLMLSTEETAIDKDLEERIEDLKRKRKTLKNELNKISQKSQLSI